MTLVKMPDTKTCRVGQARLMQSLSTSSHHDDRWPQGHFAGSDAVLPTSGKLKQPSVGRMVLTDQHVDSCYQQSCRRALAIIELQATFLQSY